MVVIEDALLKTEPEPMFRVPLMFMVAEDEALV
jgi:hypothetical protein